MKFESPTTEIVHEKEEQNSEHGAMERDVKAYESIREILKSAEGAHKRLKKSYKEVVKLLDDESRDTAEKIRTLREADPELDKLLNQAYLEDVGNNLEIEKAIADYVHAVGLNRVSRSYSKTESGKPEGISDESDINRSRAHDSLISVLTSVIRTVKNLDIDTSWASVVGSCNRGHSVSQGSSTLG